MSPSPTHLRRLIAASLRDGVELRLRLLDTCGDAIERAANALLTTVQQGGKLILFGNGGSAADAQHIAAEFTGRFVRERRPLAAIALTTDTSALTAIGNDYGYDQVFARQLTAVGRPGDLVVASSTSGNSPNVLAAVDAAHELGLTTVGLTGGDGGTLARKADIAIVVPSTTTARVQEAHITIGHLLCEAVDELLFAEDNADIPQEPPPSPAGSGKRISWDTLVGLRRHWGEEGKTVVWTNGCFDLLHAGHVESLHAARQLGDILVVGLNSDDSVRGLKGPGRPILPQQQRAALLAALEVVDYVVIFDDPTPADALARLQPDIHCKGDDYAPPGGKPIPEAPIVEEYGGTIAYLPLVPGLSTSAIVEQIRSQSEQE